MGRWLSALGLVAIAILTLRPVPTQAAASASTPLLCLVCGSNGGADVFLNLLLFAPLGVGLRLAGWRWRSVVATAALVSFAVELLQFTVVTGRDASLSDLVTNTTGAAGRRRPRRALARHCATVDAGRGDAFRRMVDPLDRYARLDRLVAESPRPARSAPERLARHGLVRLEVRGARPGGARQWRGHAARGDTSRSRRNPALAGPGRGSDRSACALGAAHRELGLRVLPAGPPYADPGAGAVWARRSPGGALACATPQALVTDRPAPGRPPSGLRRSRDPARCDPPRAAPAERQLGRQDAGGRPAAQADAGVARRTADEVRARPMGSA